MFFGATWCATAIIRASLDEVAADQVEQREQEDPHDIDEVPVESCDLYRRVVVGVELPLPRHRRDDGHDAETDDHVQRMKTGHAEIERIKHLGGSGIVAFPPEIRSWHEVVRELVGIFDRLDAKKCGAEHHG